MDIDDYYMEGDKMIFTEKYYLKRGKCCHNNCRHCPYKNKDMKNNIKSKEFYKEADSMKDGWGSYLLTIDKLKDKVENQKDICLNDACWILYGEGHCSSTWQKFQEYCCKTNLKTRKMTWKNWKVLFDEWYVKNLK